MTREFMVLPGRIDGPSSLSADLTQKIIFLRSSVRGYLRVNNEARRKSFNASIWKAA